MGTSLTAWFDVVMASTVVSTGTGSVEPRSARQFRAAAKGLIGVPRDRFKGLFNVSREIKRSSAGTYRRYWGT
jgi:hypothetical protein